MTARTVEGVFKTFISGTDYLVSYFSYIDEVEIAEHDKNEDIKQFCRIKLLLTHNREATRQ